MTRIVSTSSTVRDEHGDPVRYQHVELPAQDVDGRAGDGRSLEQIAAEWQADVEAERFDRHHRNCEAPWVCQGCERNVCPRCDPSPAEFIKCAECDWFGGAA